MDKERERLERIERATQMYVDAQPIIHLDCERLHKEMKEALKPVSHRPTLQELDELFLVRRGDCGKEDRRNSLRAVALEVLREWLASDEPVSEWLEGYEKEGE